MKLWVLRIAVLAIGVSLGGCMFTPKEHFYQNTTRYAPMAEDITTPKKKSSKLRRWLTRSLREYVPNLKRGVICFWKTQWSYFNTSAASL